MNEYKGGVLPSNQLGDAIDINSAYPQNNTEELEEIQYEYHYNDVFGVKNINLYLEEWGKQGWHVHTIAYEYPPDNLHQSPIAHILLERVKVPMT